MSLTIQMMLTDVSEAILAEYMPVGYRLEVLDQGRYVVMTDGDVYKVGHCQEVDCGVDFVFYEDSPEGLAYTQAFGLRHPEYNPLQVLYGVVYTIDGGQTFQLDKLPLRLKSQVLAELGHYTASKAAYFVSFKRGCWGKTWLEVDEKRLVLEGGRLGKDTGIEFLPLGNIENESTM